MRYLSSSKRARARSIIISLLLVFLTGCGSESSGTADIIDIDTIQTSEANYKLYECVPESIERVISTQAYITYPIHTPLFFRESGGRLKGIYVTNSQSVKKGDILAELSFDDGTLASEIRELEIQYENDSANMAIELDRRMAEINDMNNQKAGILGRLRDTGGDDARILENEARLWDIRIKKAESDYYYYTYDSQRRLSVQKEELDELREKLQGEVITAPYDGTVDSIQVYPEGKLIEPGEWIMGIYDPGEYELTFQGDSATFSYNMEIEIDVPRVGTFNGRIISDPSAPDTGESQLSYRAVFSEMPSDFKEVQSKIITVRGKSFYLSGITVIPNGGVRNEDTKKYVFILEDSVVKKRYISQGLFTPESTQILTGVGVGDMIVLN